MSINRINGLYERRATAQRTSAVNFQDETFFTRRERVRAMAQDIVDSGLKFTWAATMRADQGVRMTEDIWQLCKRSGLRRLLVGVEGDVGPGMVRVGGEVQPVRRSREEPGEPRLQVHCW